MTSLSASYHRNSNVDTSAVSDRVILFERDSRRTLVLNPTGSALWNALGTPRTPEQLIGQLQLQFPGLGAEHARHDVEAFLSELLKQNLIKPAS